MAWRRLAELRLQSSGGLEDLLDVPALKSAALSRSRPRSVVRGRSTLVTRSL